MLNQTEDCIYCWDPVDRRSAQDSLNERGLVVCRDCQNRTPEQRQAFIDERNRKFDEGKEALKKELKKTRKFENVPLNVQLDILRAKAENIEAEVEHVQKRLNALAKELEDLKI